MSSGDQKLRTKASKIIEPDILPQEERTHVSNEFTLDNLFRNIDFEKQAKDSNGNLHPHYSQPIRKGFEAIKDYVQLYSNDILNSMREMDFLCIKTSGRNLQNYKKCKVQTDSQIHKQIFIPIVNTAGLLHKVSNQCLLKGNSIDVCSNIISDHTHFMFKLAAQRIKAMTLPLTEKIPADLQPPRFTHVTINNAIAD